MFLNCLGFCRSKHTTDTSSSARQYPTVIEELCRQFSLADLRKSTNNFDKNRVIRCGSSGEVYKGCLQHNDASDYTVAVKRFYGWEVFKNESELLCQLHHPNIVSLIGFCNHKKEKIIVYEYMSNGSLDQHLGGEDKEALSWKKRLKICKGTACGLHYLHAGAKRTVIHCDISPANILLDNNMEPKLAGFSDSVLGAYFMSKPKPIKVDFLGTYGYIPVELMTHDAVTDKSDVYSFGMVLLHIVCGRNFGIAREHLEKSVEENIDPNIEGKIAPECWEVFIDIMVRCLKYEPDERPTMGEVEVQLEHALSLQEQTDLTNTNGHYTLFSTTIINWAEELKTKVRVELETNTEDSDIEEM